ncbi:hypothetical protein B484DRAFT_256886 [Ochromonadaceae sp. CCMP2298]|nr:hypothetical protein B484DRAFT_256886 [Ochromonadaceae sp. CCMP2298]
MQTVRLLLQHGAVINGATGSGVTALHVAYAASNFDVAKQLERAGALPLPDKDGRLPWDIRDRAAYGRHLDSRWYRRRAFVLMLRVLGRTRAGGAGGAGGGFVGVSGVLLWMLAAREVQSNIASYL